MIHKAREIMLSVISSAQGTSKSYITNNMISSTTAYSHKLHTLKFSIKQGMMALSFTEIVRIINTLKEKG